MLLIVLSDQNFHTVNNKPQIKKKHMLEGHFFVGLGFDKFHDSIRFFLTDKFSVRFDSIQIKIDYFRYISGIVHAIFSQGKTSLN